MLLSCELGFRVGDALSPTATAARRKLSKIGNLGLDPRPAAGLSSGGGWDGDFRSGRIFGAAAKAGDFSGFSYESEGDLGVMVNDFLENGSGDASLRYSSDSDSGFGADFAHLMENVLFHKHARTQYESDLQTVVHSLLFSLNEVDLYLVNEDQCNGSCIRQVLVKRLKLAGYDATVCTSKWQGFKKVPGGDHEYIDVVFSDTWVLSV